MEGVAEFWVALSSPTVWPFAMVLLGLLTGSFLNVVALRMPARLEWTWRQEARLTLDPTAELEPQPLNWTTDPSRCPHCEHRLAFWENLPVIGYAILRGRCHSCKTPISPRYLIVEIVAALLFLVSALTQSPFNSLVAAGFCSTLFLLSLIDAKTFVLPDNIVIPLLWAGLVFSGHAWVSPLQAIWGAALGWLFLWGVYWLFRLTTGKEGMGYGDFKLLAAIGAFLGPVALLPVLLVSSITGAIFGLGARLLPPSPDVDGVPSGAFPFGPFLAAGGVVALFTKGWWGPLFIIPGLIAPG
jgi:leader peptidase (prepilin peptidase)/N-methyltransferase